jgi:DNA-directed RNA polymerase subunit RPC12/RpoP
LYRETFYVCRNCGRDGETIEKQTVNDSSTFTVRGAMKWGWGSAAIAVPFLVWIRWWQAAAVIGATLLASPAIYWWENRKIAIALAARGLPRADAPGLFPIAEPTEGCQSETVIGQLLPAEAGEIRATGPCCDKPDWIEAFRVKDEDRVPCPTCGRGIMVIAEHSIH